MDLILNTNSYRKDGIFGVMESAGGEWSAFSLEHAYDDGTGLFVPKVARNVTYTCVRHPANRLPYETFMLKGVPDFQGEPVNGILIHILNLDRESQGCIGVGKQLGELDGESGILQSKAAFLEFMKLQNGVSSFRLQIIG